MMSAGRLIAELEKNRRARARGTTTRRYFFWQNEPVYCPPATSTKTITWTGELVSAKLHVELETGSPPWKLTAVTLNGETVWTGSSNVVDVDVTNVLFKGENQLKLDYIADPTCVLGSRRNCLAYVDITVSGEILPPISPWEPMIWIIIMAAVMFGIFGLVRAVRG